MGNVHLVSCFGMSAAISRNLVTSAMSGISRRTHSRHNSLPAFPAESVLKSWQTETSRLGPGRLPVVDVYRTFFVSLSEEIADTITAMQGVMVA